jgi:hypothetical protein
MQGLAWAWVDKGEPLGASPNAAFPYFGRHTPPDNGMGTCAVGWLVKSIWKIREYKNAQSARPVY